MNSNNKLKRPDSPREPYRVSKPINILPTIKEGEVWIPSQKERDALYESIQRRRTANKNSVSGE